MLPVCHEIQKRLAILLYLFWDKAPFFVFFDRSPNTHGHLKGERLYLYIYSPWRLYYGRFFSVNSLMSSPWKRFKGIIIFVLWKFLCQFDTSYLENNSSVLIVVVVFKILTFSAPRKQISKFSCH